MAEQALTNFSHHTEDKPIVLIADDSRVVRVSLKNILKNDCTVIEAENGEQAWNILCDTPSVALIFSDLSMPKLDGRGLLSKIRASDSTQIAKLPFIVVTGNEQSPEIHQELTQLGADEVINKPFEPSHIRNFLTTFGNNDIHQPDLAEPQTDFIDGVIDKAQFSESASRELAFAIRNKNELALALIKIDQIDEITDHYSDPAIEHILLTLIEIITQHIHPDDTLAYFGSGLFAILRPASNAIGTRYLGRRILEDLSAKQFYLGESEQIVSASIGISAPDIKPGTRLIELITLAERRLNTAMENGGNRVVDKGNDNQSTVNLVGQASELNYQSNNDTTSSQTAPTHNSSEIQRLTAEQFAEINARQGNNLHGEAELSSELIEHKQTIERLTNENRQFINEIGHWKRQSAEAENLRRQLFEVESQQQQLQVKYNTLHDENISLIEQTDSITERNNALLQRIEAVESDNRILQQTIESAQNENSNILHRAEKVAIENKDLLKRIQELEIENQNLVEELRNGANNQTQHFFEEENRRLEHQLTELTSRAEKAEAENHKSNQLVNSLNDNIKLLQMQLDQSQQQLSEAQQKQQTVVTTSAVVARQNCTDTNTHSQPLTHTEPVSDTQNADMEFNAMPDSIPYSAKSEPSSVHLFPEKDQIKAKHQVKNKPAFPPFRVEPEPLLFKEGFHPSSFAIAGIIFIAMMLIGGSYLYSIFNADPTAKETVEATVSEPTPDKNPVNFAPSPSPKPSMSVNEPVANPASAKLPSDIENIDEKPTLEALRLEKESTLRKRAEEEYNRRARSTL
jgi:diguanylate cyclase (GGDEF)-like protein